MSRTTRKHKAEAPKKLRVGIFTCSTSRYEQQMKGEKPKDSSGDLIESLLKREGHDISIRRIISDDPVQIRKGMKQVLRSSDVDVAIFCGGTGVTRSDVTIETVSPLLEKTLPGFGEIFRRLTYDHLGSAAVMSRANAGVANGKAFFCIPGSPDAAKLCIERLILPEAGHIIKHARE